MSEEENINSNVSQDLVNAVQELVDKGVKEEDLKDYLVSQGWQEEAVDEVFKSIKKSPSFWQQLPTYSYFQALDANTANLSPKAVSIIGLALMVLVIVIGYFIYLFMDPYAMQGTSRDEERQAMYDQLTIAINRYHDEKGVYPQTLGDLVPEFISKVPVDPETNIPYNYSLLDGGESYGVCIHFETKSPTDGCLRTDVIKTEILEGQ